MGSRPQIVFYSIVKNLIGGALKLVTVARNSGVGVGSSKNSSTPGYSRLCILVGSYIERTAPGSTFPFFELILVNTFFVRAALIVVHVRCAPAETSTTKDLLSIDL
jgi:hypothetical protein